MPFEELKSKQSVMWGIGPYQNITETIADIHEAVVDRLDPQPGDAWLDLACGTGAVSEGAARRGADVTGIDLAPALIETAKERAQDQGLEIDYRVGDCENLAVEDGAFDKLSSTCGSCLRPTTRRPRMSLHGSSSPAGELALPTGPRRAGSPRCSR